MERIKYIKNSSFNGNFNQNQVKICLIKTGLLSNYQRYRNSFQGKVAAEFSFKTFMVHIFEKNNINCSKPYVTGKNRNGVILANL